MKGRIKDSILSRNAGNENQITWQLGEYFPPICEDPWEDEIFPPVSHSPVVFELFRMNTHQLFKLCAVIHFWHRVFFCIKERIIDLILSWKVHILAGNILPTVEFIWILVSRCLWEDVIFYPSFHEKNKMSSKICYQSIIQTFNRWGSESICQSSQHETQKDKDLIFSRNAGNQNSNNSTVTGTGPNGRIFPANMWTVHERRRSFPLCVSC